jgi:uncharacterized protein YbcI
MNWKWTDHIELQLIERKIQRELVETTISKPDRIVEGKKNRKIYQKIMGKKLVRVVTEENRLITVYLTDKIKKYMGGD